MPIARLRAVAVSAAMGLFICLAAGVSAQLCVGAGRANITPEPNMIPEPYTSIHDPIYTRAILIENGRASALLMNLDVGIIPSSFTEKLEDEITARYGIPRENMIISAVHVHSSPASLGGPPRGSTSGPTPAMLAFVRRVHDGMLAAVQQAHDSLQPAEMGFGEGKLYLNVNRDAIDPKTRLWAQEANLDFPSDKTLAVLEFRKPHGGAPIAVYMNYAMHSITMFLRGQISGDFPEVASRYIEGVYNDKVVAVWSQGAEGDQNPFYLRPIDAIDEARIRHEMPPDKQKDKGEYNAAIMRLFMGGAKRPNLPLDPKLAAQSWQVVEAIGTIAAEETLRVMGEIPHFSSAAVIQGSSKVVTCPGRKRLDRGREGDEGHYEDGPPATVQVGALRIGTVALGRINAEPYNKIGQEVKNGSPFRETMLVALASGGPAGGYIPSDDAANHYTFQALGTHFKEGCAEMSIVNGIDGLLFQDLEGSAQQ